MKGVNYSLAIYAVALTYPLYPIVTANDSSRQGGGFLRLRYFIVACASFALVCCAPPSATTGAQPAATTAAAEKPVPGSQIGQISVMFLSLQRFGSAPAGCTAALYGSIAAMRSGALCVCQKSADGRGVWMHAGSDKACWPDNK